MHICWLIVTVLLGLELSNWSRLLIVSPHHLDGLHTKKMKRDKTLVLVENVRPLLQSLLIIQVLLKYKDQTKGFPIIALEIDSQQTSLLWQEQRGYQPPAYVHFHPDDVTALIINLLRSQYYRLPAAPMTLNYSPIQLTELPSF